MFNCANCNKKFNRKKYLISHLNRKTSCNKNLTCKSCKKTFSRTEHFNKHINRKYPCSNREYTKMDLLKIKLDIINSDIVLKEKDIERLDKEIKLEEIKKSNIKNSKLNSYNTYNNITNNNITNNITINNFGDPNYKVPPVSLLKGREMARGTSLETLVELIKHNYNNPKYPENRCIKNDNNKKDFIIMKDEEWVNVKYDDIYPPLKKIINGTTNKIYSTLFNVSNCPIIPRKHLNKKEQKKYDEMYITTKNKDNIKTKKALKIAI